MARSVANRLRQLHRSRPFIIEHCEARTYLMAANEMFAQRGIPVPSTSSAILLDLNSDGREDLVYGTDFLTPTLTVQLNQGGGTFGPRQNYNTSGSNVYLFALKRADMNGDGRDDIIATNASAKTLSIYYNLTTGLSGPNVITPPVSSTSGFDFEIADVNSDNRLDLLLLGISNATVAVMINNGGGQFSLGTTTTGTVANSRSTTGDVNGDGRVDLLRLDLDGYYEGFLNNGDGTLTALPRSRMNADTLTSVMLTADLNGDGLVDIAFCDSSDRTITVAMNLGNGGGGFGPRAFYTGQSTNLRALIARDVNGDGRLDLIAAGSGVEVLLATGPGTFAAPVSYLAGRQNVALLPTDLDGDGNLDIMHLDGGDDLIGILWGKGQGAFATTSALNSVFALMTMAVGDFNNDGRADIALTESTVLRMRFGNAAGSFTDGPARNMPVTGVLVTGDFNGDGRLDLACAGADFSTLRVAVLLNQGGGVFANPTTYAFGSGSVVTSVVAADFDGDGRLDLAATNYFSNTISTLRGNGDGTFASPVTFNTTQMPSQLIAADVNADGRADLLATSYVTSGGVIVHLSQGSGFAPATFYATAFQAKTLAAADFTRDGILDLITANDQGRVTMLRGTGNGAFAAGVHYFLGQPAPFLAKPQYITSTDIDSDGDPDAITANAESQSMSVLLNNGDGTFATPTQYVGVDTPNIVQVADVDLDGRPDLLFLGTSTYRVIIHRNLGTSGTPIAALTGRTLNVSTAIASGQSISLSESSNVIRVSSGASTFTFPAGDVDRVIVAGTSNSDTLNLNSALSKPWSFNGGAGDDSLNVNAGAHVVAADLGSTSANLSVSVSAAGQIAFDASQRLNNLSVAGSAALLSNGDRWLVVRTLTIAPGARVDLYDNDAMITAPNRAQIEAHVRAALHDGAWDGPGLTSSAARTNPSANTSLGVLSGEEFLNSNGGTFHSASVQPDAVLVKYTYIGDVDFNGQVDVSDYNLIDFGFVNHLTGWANGNVDYSDAVDVSDYNLIDYAFTTQVGQL